MKKIFILICLFVLAFSTSSIAAQKDGLLKVYFLNVGQGDSSLVITPQGHTILIDGGPDNRVLTELGRLLPFYEKEIDLVIVSHPHADHIGGLISVLERYEVRNIIQSRTIYDSGEFKAWHESVLNEGAKNIEALAGTVIDLGSNAKISILYPESSYAGVRLKKPHQANVVSMLSYKDIDIMFTGDMEADVERILVEKPSNLEAEILKVGHHGSKTSTSPEFLEATNPKVAVIEVGKNNRYGLPNQNVLQRLRQFGIPIFRTDQNGNVKVISDGHKFQISADY